MDNLLETINIDDLCRICLKPYNVMIPLFVVQVQSAISVAELLDFTLNLQVTYNVNLPNFICKQCETELYQIIDFKSKFEQSENLLQQYLESKLLEIPVHVIDDVQPDIVEIVKETNVEEHEVPITQNRATFSKRKRYNCSKCWKTFSRHFNLQRHQKVHLKAKENPVQTNQNQSAPLEPFKCKECSRTYSNAYNLKRHLAVHLSEKHEWQFSCGVCYKSFSLWSSLQTHKLLHSGKGLLCSKCGKSYPNERMLETHTLRVHSAMKRAQIYLCYICAKDFCNKFSFERHLLTHKAVSKPYKCKICSKNFAQRGSLVLHHKIHTGEKRFICETCSRAFSRLHNLQRHKLTHSNIRPYVCDSCGKSFTVKQTLIVHKRLHTGEKPYSCTVCQKAFVDKSSLKKHLRVHSKSSKEDVKMP